MSYPKITRSSHSDLTIIPILFCNPKYALFNNPINKTIRFKFSQIKGKTINEFHEYLKNSYKVEKFDPSKRNLHLYFHILNNFLITGQIEKDTHRMLGFLEMDLSKHFLPSMMVTGWYDMFFEKQFEEFLEIKKKAHGKAKKYSRIIIGPWAHAAIGHPESKLSNAGLGKFYNEFFNLNWNRYWLMKDMKAFSDINKPSIKYWVMGKKRWRYTEEWPPNYVKYKKLFIHSLGKANSYKGDGKLNFNKPLNESEDTYIFNPMNPVITKGGRNLAILKGAHNQKDAEKRKDVLVYSTQSLKKGIEIAGPVKMILFASSSGKDTDFMVKLVDVYPNGKTINILDAGIRVRFRNGEEHPVLIEPNKTYRYEIILGNISNYFRKRHKIRIEITSSNFPRFDINSNLGGEGNPRDYKIVTQKIYHSQEFPSHLIIPILKDKVF